MSIYAAICLGMLAVALVIVAVTAMPVLRKLQANRRGLAVIQTHPTLVALRQAQAIGDRVSGLKTSVDEIRARTLRIAQSAARIVSASAQLQLEVDRVSFATRLMLQTFVPTLRGSMAD